MKIDVNLPLMSELQRGQAAGSGAAGSARETTGSALQEDSAQLSSGADQVQKLVRRLADVPDVRQEKVANLRQAIAQGTYRVSPGHIAEAMMQDRRSART